MGASVSSTTSVPAGLPLPVSVVAQSQPTATLAGASAPAPDPTAGDTAVIASTLAAPAPASAKTPAAASQPAAQAETAAQLNAAIKTIQDYVQPQQTASMQIDKATGQTYVKIMDPQTQQTILQIPPEQVLAMAQKMQTLGTSKTASGGLEDQQG